MRRTVLALVVAIGPCASLMLAGCMDGVTPDCSLPDAGCAPDQPETFPDVVTDDVIDAPIDALDAPDDALDGAVDGPADAHGDVRDAGSDALDARADVRDAGKG